MNYRSCEVMNKNFLVTKLGDISCIPASEIVHDSLQRAYIFTNLFFYDITEREVNKLRQKINDKRQNLLDSTGIPPEAVDRQFPNLSAQFKAELGDNSFDPMIKIELAKISRQMSLQLTPAEKKQIDDMYNAICESEIQKFKKAVLITTPNNNKPYQINFSQKYLDNLPPRCKQFLKPTIKMLAYMDGLEFETFEIDFAYQLTYTWSLHQHEFNEENLKDEIKSLIAKKPEDIV